MEKCFDTSFGARGLGMDSTRVSRFRAMRESILERMANKILSPSEREEYDASGDRPACLARFFCQKECISKCLGTGFSHGVHFSCIIIKRDELGRPTVWLKDGAARRAEELGMTSIRVSLTDEGDIVSCIAIGF